MFPRNTDESFILPYRKRTFPVHRQIPNSGFSPPNASEEVEAPPLNIRNLIFSPALKFQDNLLSVRPLIKKKLDNTHPAIFGHSIAALQKSNCAPNAPREIT